MSVNEKLLQAIRARKQKQAEFGYGILTADKHLAGMVDTVGLDCCYRFVGNRQTSFNDLMEKAAETLVYSSPDMDLELAVSSGDFKAKLDGAPKDFELPKNTLIVFRHKLTTSTKDRDGDILRSDGAVVDPKMLLLFNHIHTSPLGPYLYTASQDGKALRVVSAIVDMNPLSHDAAVMVDNKMGRFSHGFRALDFGKVKEGTSEEEGGFDVKAFEIMEESLVSVPANPEAETEDILLSLVSKGKLTSPLMKEYGRVLGGNRPTTVPGITFKTEDKVGDRSKAQTITCGSFAELKEAVDVGLIGGKKDENEPGSGGGEGEKRQAGSPKEADDEAKRKEGEAGFEEVKMFVSGTLVDSWEWVGDKLRSKAKRFLLANEVVIPENGWVGILATYPDKAILCIEAGMMNGDEHYYQASWSKVNGEPEFTGKPKIVDVETTTEIRERRLKVVRKEEEFECECIECGFKVKSKKHCKEIKCSKCGGEMRRAERPGPGRGFVPPDGKPYPNEHSARLRDPGDFEADSFRRKKNKFGTGIHAVFGRLKEKTTLTLQAIRFAKDEFSASEAKLWLKEHEYKPIKFEPAKEEEGKGLKLGRVLSKANEGRIRDARDDVIEASKMDISRPCKALLKSAASSLSEVVSSLGVEGQAKIEPPTVKEAIAIVLSEASTVERGNLMGTLQAMRQVEKRSKTLRLFRGLKRSI